MITMDVKIIRRCYGYLEKYAKELIIMEDCVKYYRYLDEVINECQGQQTEISRNCIDNDMEDLLSDLEEWEKELFF